MGETKTIVIDHYPVDRLPEDLREGLEGGQFVRVTVEAGDGVASSHIPLRAFLGCAPGRYRDPAEILEEVDRLRNEWDAG